MKNKLESLSIEAMSLIKSPSLKDPSSIARLAPIPAKIHHLISQLDDIEREASHIENLLQSFKQKSRRAGSENNGSLKTNFPAISHREQITRREHKKIRIEFDGSLIGKPGKNQVIDSHKASDSLADFLTLLYKIKGAEFLEALCRYKVNRGMLVSKNPKEAYRYRSGSGEKIYSHQAIGDSGFYVLTHSKTDQKVEDVRSLCRDFLKWPDSKFKVEEVEKNAWLKELLA